MSGATAAWVGKASVKGGSETMRMILLSFTTVGIVFVWGVEMTYCTPYLLNLGLSKSTTSLVWIAGPLSGLIVQPIIGALADGSTSKYGRRRPVIAAGSIIVSLALWVLGFTQEIVAFFGYIPSESKNIVITLAIVAIYVVDFAINAVMSCSRSLIVDTLPIEKQQAGAAWSSRLAAIGHVIGYAAGAIDLVNIFGTTLGDTQFKQLVSLAILFVLFSSSVSCWAVTERILLPRPHTANENRFGVVHQIWDTLLNLPPRIQAICWAQFWAWIGWFPFQFYSTTWVGEIYFRYDAPLSAKTGDSLGDIGRIGSKALVMYSTVTFLGAWLLPLIIKSPDKERYTKRPPQSIAKFVNVLNDNKPDIVTAWIIGDLIFASAMFMAPMASSFKFATTLVCICGIPWSIANWAPVATLGVEVNRLSGPSSKTHRRNPSAGALEKGCDSDSSNGELSGIYFGILNIYSTIPQFLGNFISTIVFSILEPGKSPELATDAHPSERHPTDGPNAIAVCLFIGAISAVVASYAAFKLKRLQGSSL
ncbi:General alpha-glucoside permease [Ceratocystis fimbriata CBS 114723]|uniref:General alpha-glucoside permease n=1 Tax=Ceratocystis fimbriata CBS 114723 TaxID=1035309 RepID=A0A2C5WWT6_9PEZI|nr:General alpha-glucoside permease [Ceratocystis fimbriata CBS 114723]